ncbi:hypothetical protein LCGC14_2463690 [marine sediment metagenome]|uniref:Uncharacterized protein n=1 Tax=marine sediment metagenome TaxID=412755 RepID=A0A0F9DPM4_9ZZZZ
MLECDCKLCKVLEATILDMSDCEDMEEAVNYFEGVRHQDGMVKTKELFDELSVNQLAILFKLLIDSNQLELVNNKIRFLNQRGTE